MKNLQESNIDIQKLLDPLKPISYSYSKTAN